MTWKTGLIWQCLIGGGIITIVEFIAGIILNVWLGGGIWDYSHIPLNILGQICLPYSVAWVFLALAAILADDYLRYFLFEEEKPKYTFFNKK
jgi:uncharacterized membrane protein